jgi:hypothetical protein
MPARAKPKPKSKVKPKSIQTSAVPCTIQAADGAGVRRFSLEAYTGEPMSIWPWDDPVVIDLASIDLTSQRIPALYDHRSDSDYIVGQVESIAVQNGKLVASGIFTPTDDPSDRNYSKKVLDRADAGYQWQVSVGGNPGKVERVQAGQTIDVNGRTYQGPVLIAKNLQLREISFVVLGGDRLTSAVVSRYKSIKGSAMTFEEWLLSMGFEDVSTLSEVQKANLQQVYNDEYGESEEEEEVTDEDAVKPEEEVTVERETTDEEEMMPTNARSKKSKLNATSVLARVKAISRLCEEHGNPKIKANNGKKVKLLSHAIENNWSVDKVKSELLAMKRSSRHAGPAVIVKSHDKSCTLQALQGALLVRAGLALDNKAFTNSVQAIALKLPQWLRAGINDSNRNQIMEAAHKYSDMSAVDICREALRLEGKSIPTNRSEMIQAAFSGSNLANIFTTNVNAILLASYLEAPDTTMSWTKEAEVADFKTQERIRVEVGDGLSKLPRGGTADDASFADALESYKIARYAKRFQIDEQDIIDDMLGAISDTPLRLGQAAARLRPDLVYSILLSNPTLTATGRALFNTTDGNLGSSSALSAATLKSAIAAINKIQENGANLNLTATHLIVPPALRFVAKELIASTAIVIAGTAGSVTERGTANTLADENLQLVSDARLENGVVDPATETSNAGSSTTWYLASVMAHTIEVGYLRGTGKAPQVRSFTLDRGQYGIGWDVKMDIGAKALDWKGLRKTTA